MHLEEVMHHAAHEGSVYFYQLEGFSGSKGFHGYSRGGISDAIHHAKPTALLYLRHLLRDFILQVTLQIRKPEVSQGISRALQTASGSLSL